jgi:glucan phosphoethanolaminetransferase (alkaline phosphatase superfamily)
MIPALLLIIAAILFRIVTGFFGDSHSIGWLNFAPIAAIALCAAAYFPRKYKFTVPMTALLISDVVLNAHYGFSLFSPFVLSHYVGFGIVGCLGLLLQRRASWRTLLPASLAASLIFYIVTNFVSWVYDPGYVKNFAGLIQSLTVGLPEYSATPSWMFFRNSLVSDLVFTFLFVVCMNVGRSREESRARAARLRPLAAH